MSNAGDAPPPGPAIGAVEELAERSSSFLEEAQRLGFLGPGPVAGHVRHAFPLVEALPPSGRVVDLGSGGGVPALILALARPELTWILVESRVRRVQWLEEAVGLAGLADRVSIVGGRAEVAGRGEFRGSAVAVTARSFAPPAVTAECGSPFLALGGVLWVAEPPEPRPGRWPESGLALLGLRHSVGPSVQSWQGFEQVQPCPEKYARREGLPAKRPLF